MQTSLDWFLENLPERFKYALLNTCEEGIKKAKQKEKEQICNAYVEGLEGLWISAEEYYNREFNQNK
jgi:hypothetical protein